MVKALESRKFLMTKYYQFIIMISLRAGLPLGDKHDRQSRENESASEASRRETNEKNRFARRLGRYTC